MNLLWLLMLAAAIVTALASGRADGILPALLDGSTRGISLTLELAAAYGLWMGVLQIAREAGMLRALARLMRPVLRWLFPGVDPGGPAGEAIATNLSANMLGMGNAATPAGLEAMRHLSADMRERRATNAMCAFLVVNCSSVQLYPAVVVAMRQAAGSADPSEIVIPALLATICSTAAGIVAVKCIERAGGRGS
ncbi:MAG: nucleoside recognition domain-containing protein [Christensenellales bacterium]|jgi:spore maturation protein A